MLMVTMFHSKVSNFRLQLNHYKALLRELERDSPPDNPTRTADLAANRQHLLEQIEQEKQTLQCELTQLRQESVQLKTRILWLDEIPDF
jgi:hypothetical protein